MNTLSRLVGQQPVGAIALIIGLTIGSPNAPALASTPPPGPGPVQPSNIPGCWRWLLEKRIEKRTGSYTSVGGQVIRYAEFRTVATSLRWCPSSGYKVVVWRGSWGPGRR